MSTFLPIDPAAARVFGAELEGPEIQRYTMQIGGLRGLFADETARAALPQDRVAYRVASCRPVADGTPGGLFLGFTTLEPGLVGAEYLMTRGHYHARRECAEFYWCVEGEGLLLLMDTERRARAEQLAPGSLHYIPGGTAHRLVNTGAAPLRVGACWPSDAGHDYAAIEEAGFSARVLCVDEKPRLVEASR